MAIGDIILKPMLPVYCISSSNGIDTIKIASASAFCVLEKDKNGCFGCTSVVRGHHGNNFGRRIINWRKVVIIQFIYTNILYAIYASTILINSFTFGV